MHVKKNACFFILYPKANFQKELLQYFIQSCTLEKEESFYLKSNHFFESLFGILFFFNLNYDNKLVLFIYLFFTFDNKYFAE